MDCDPLVQTRRYTIVPIYRARVRSSGTNSMLSSSLSWYVINQKTCIGPSTKTSAWGITRACSRILAYLSFHLSSGRDHPYSGICLRDFFNDQDSRGL
jgi:hypothetical protein